MTVHLRWRRTRWLVPFVVAAALFLGIAATETAAQPVQGGPSTSFKVLGRVGHPKIYKLADLQALPAHTVNTSFIGPGGSQNHSFTGALLNDIVAAAAPRFDA